jgi:hypothetical protein
MTNPVLSLESSIGAPSTPWLTLDDPTAGLIGTGTLAADYFTTGYNAVLSAYSISTQRGRQRLLERAQAGTLTALLPNDQRQFDPTNTSSPYYSNGESLVQPMRDVRLSATWGRNGVTTGGAATDYLSTPHKASLATTDLYIEWYGWAKWDTLAADATLVAKWGTAGNRSWRLQARGSNDLRFSWSNNGTTTNNIAFNGVVGYDNDRLYLQLGFLASNGTAYLNVYRPDGTIGSFNSGGGAGSTTLFNASSTPITIGVDGAGNDAGVVSCHWFRQYENGHEITSGTHGLGTWDEVENRGRVVAAFDAAWLQTGDTSVVSFPTGETWTLNGDINIVGSTTYPLWQGFSDDWLIEWMDPADSLVTLTATDGFKALARVDNAATGAAGTGETTGDRIDRILDAAGWPTVNRDLDTGQTTVQSTTLAQNALTELYLTADTELGNLYMGPTNKVTFRDRHARLTDMRSKQPWWTFGDSTGEIPYSDLVISTNDDLVYNDISIARVGGTAQTANDSASIEAHLTRTFIRTDLTHQTDAASQHYANYILAANKDADLRFDALTIDAQADDDRRWPVILGVEIGDRVTVRRRPPGGGDAIERDCYVEGIAHEIEPPMTWRTTLQLSDAAHQLGFVLDDSELAVLDTSTLSF